MYKEFLEVSHRPYPLPDAPWVMTQVWKDLLFMHFPVEPGVIRALVPRELEIDMYSDMAWITIIPFEVTGMRARFAPLVPVFSSYLELNVRTYVVRDGVPGIYFFSLDADELLAVAGARVGTGLPYRYAKMKFRRDQASCHFRSRRRFDGASPTLDVSYRPGDVLYEASPDSLDYWLLERYCLYSFWNGKLMRGDIHHDKWKVTRSDIQLRSNSMLSFLEHCQPAFCHYSRRRRVFFYPLKEAGGGK
ncbi:MAG: YqjF family protein [Bacillus sp. (in: firmicutes)]